MIIDFTLRLVAALVLGGLIGIEREYRSKDAGFRTHFLVALGSALFTLVSQYGFGVDLKDSSRVAAQVVSGIGFLGAGTIIFQKNVVRGLTTAAGLWVTAAIGLACDTGMLAIAAITTAMVLVGLEMLHAVIPHIGTTTVQLSFSSSSRQLVKEVLDRLRHDSVDICSFDMKDRRTSSGTIYEVKMDVKMKRGGHNAKILTYMTDFDDVIISSLE